MKSICLISTVYEGARAIESIWELHPKKVILLVDKGSKKEEIRTAISEIKKLSKIEGVSFDFEEHEISTNIPAP